jgi:hypothetical protein
MDCAPIKEGVNYSHSSKRSGSTATRVTSCHAWWANQFRLLLSSLAYVLLETLRRLELSGTQLARAQVGTIRLRLLKIGAVITRNTRRVRLWLSSSFPLQQLFCSCLVHFYG